MSAEVIGWQDEHLLDHRRRLRNGFMVSVAVHGLLFATLAISPPRLAPPRPSVLSVELVVAPAASHSASAATEPVAPRATPEPIDEPPPPPPPPSPPIAKAPVQVLPENSPRRIRKREAKVEVARRTRPEKERRPPRRRRAKELSYEDAMAALGNELGSDENADLLRPAPVSDASESSGRREPGPGVAVSPEMAAWVTATTRRIQNNWKGVASYRGQGLVTRLSIELSSTGQVLGTPRVVRSSGDPYFDDNAVRAVQFVDPLPAPPRAGVTEFNFRSEAY